LRRHVLLLRRLRLLLLALAIRGRCWCATTST
jgi:hypothetical protein